MARQSSFNYEELLACGRGELFGPGNAQLPLPPMLMFDRITSIGEDGGAYGKGHVVAELDVRPDLWFFPCHFKGDPVMPGCLGVDALWQMVGFFLGWSGSPGRGRALGIGEVKFSDQVLPTHKKVVYGVDLKPETFVELSDQKTLVAIKESSDDPRRLTDIVNLTGDRYTLFCGVDDLMMESALLGAVGCVHGIANAFPAETVRM